MYTSKMTPIRKKKYTSKIIQWKRIYTIENDTYIFIKKKKKMTLIYIYLLFSNRFILTEKPVGVIFG